jgi:hypothetical protein
MVLISRLRRLELKEYVWNLESWRFHYELRLLNACDIELEYRLRLWYFCLFLLELLVLTNIKETLGRYICIYICIRHLFLELQAWRWVQWVQLNQSSKGLESHRLESRITWWGAKVELERLWILLLSDLLE